MKAVEEKKVKEAFPGASKSCKCGNVFMDDSKFCRKCGRARNMGKVAGKKEPIDIDNLELDSINLEKELEKPRVKNSKPQKVVAQPKTTKNDGKK
jgi:hypothetical protein